MYNKTPVNLIKQKLSKDKKNSFDIDLIYNFLNSNKTFNRLFHDFDEQCYNQIEKMKSLCSVFSLRNIQKGGVIITEGSKLDMNFYYILKGEVLVLKKIRKDIPEKKISVVKKKPLIKNNILKNIKNSLFFKNINIKKEKKNNLNKSENSEFIDWHLNFNEDTISKEEVWKYKREYGTIITTLKEGAFFGEKSLLEDTKRTATIISFNNCELIQLSKKNFNDKLVSFMNESKFLKENIIKNSLGNNIDNNFYDRILNSLEPIHFKRGQKIILQNQLIENLYFIINGDIMVKHNFNKKDILNLDEWNNINIYQKNLFINNSFKPIINYEILIKGDIFGEELIFNDDNFYSGFTFEATSLNVNLFIIKKKTIKDYIFMNDNFKKELKNIYNFRILSRKKKLTKYLNNYFNNTNFNLNNKILNNNKVYNKINEDKNKYIKKKNYYIKSKVLNNKLKFKFKVNKNIKSYTNRVNHHSKSDTYKFYLKTKNINIIKKKKKFLISLNKYY